MAQPTHAGQAVVDTRGRIGITDDQPAVRGSRQGQVGVMFLGAPYSTWAQVADLTVVTLTAEVVA